MRSRTDSPGSTQTGAPDQQVTRNSILRISDSKTIQLIQEWQNEPCLWNTRLPSYPNKEARTQAIAAITERLGMPNFKPEHVALKFKNLRNSYCQELKKIVADETYKPKVIWFSYMDKFLRPHLQNTYKTPQLDIPTPNPTIIKTEIESDDNNIEDWSVENTMQSEASCSNSVRIDSTFSERSLSEAGENSNHSQAQKRKLSTDSIRRHENSCKRNDNRTESALRIDGVPYPTARSQDHYDNFGIYIASLLRMLPKKKAMMLEPKIVDLIVSVGLEELSDEQESDT